MVRAPAVKYVAVGLIPGACCPVCIVIVFLVLPVGLLMLMGQRICSAPDQFGCYQHGYEQKGQWCSSTVQLPSTDKNEFVLQ